MNQSILKVDEILNSEDRFWQGGSASDKLRVEIAGVAELPTRFGNFKVYAFYNNKDGKEHAALVRGNVDGADNVPVRIHSECLTGDVLGSYRCDCRDQLEAALKALGRMDKGILLYMRQEGRGIGFANKIRAYGLQENGFDTVQANLALGFNDDEREYGIAAYMLKALNVKSIDLMTNNPRKIADIEHHGIRVNSRIPHVMKPNQYNRLYLETKARKSGHMIDFRGEENRQRLDPQRLLSGATADLLGISMAGD